MLGVGIGRSAAPPWWTCTAETSYPSTGAHARGTSNRRRPETRHVTLAAGLDELVGADERLDRAVVSGCPVTPLV